MAALCVCVLVVCFAFRHEGAREQGVQAAAFELDRTVEMGAVVFDVDSTWRECTDVAESVFAGEVLYIVDDVRQLAVASDFGASGLDAAAYEASLKKGVLEYAGYSDVEWTDLTAGEQATVAGFSCEIYEYEYTYYTPGTQTPLYQYRKDCYLAADGEVCVFSLGSSAGSDSSVLDAVLATVAPAA